MSVQWKKNYIKAFGSNLRKLRRAQKITQLDLAKRSGVSLSHISRMECGSRGPTVFTIRDLADGLKILPAVLLDFKFDMPEIKKPAIADGSEVPFAVTTSAAG